MIESSRKRVLGIESDSRSRDSRKGIPYNTKDYIGRGSPQVDRSFVLNSNSISYILVTIQYFRASLGDTPLDLSRLPT